RDWCGGRRPDRCRCGRAHHAERRRLHARQVIPSPCTLAAPRRREAARLAAEAARERIRARLKDAERADPPIEMQFSLADQWSRRLFVALCRRYGLAPYRYRRQRYTTVMLRVPHGFAEQVLWAEFRELNQALQAHLNEITLRVIREDVDADASEAAE